MSGYEILVGKQFDLKLYTVSVELELPPRIGAFIAAQGCI